MAEHLYLQEGRQVLSEFGFGLAYDFGAPMAQAIKRLLKAGAIHLTDPNAAGVMWTVPADAKPTAFYDEIGGHFMGRPAYAIPDTTLADWTQTDGTWTAVQPFYDGVDASYASAMAQTEAADWVITKTAETALGTPVAIRFITYDGTGRKSGNEDVPLIFKFGGVWKLHLYRDGHAWLIRQKVEGPYVLDYDVPVVEFDWMTSDKFEGHVHQLLIYEARSKLVVRSGSWSVQGKVLGAVYDDPDAQAEPPDDADPDAPTDTTPEGEPIKHALQAGQWSVTGTGRIALGMASMQWIGETNYVWRGPNVVAAAGSTQPVTVTVTGVGTEAPTVDSDGNEVPQCTVTTYDENDADWPQSGADFSPAKTQLAWVASFTSGTAPYSGSETYFLSALHLNVQPIYAADGNVGTDVIALAGVADKQLAVTREGELSREQFAATLLTHKVALVSYILPNMPVRSTVDAVTAFRGLSNSAQWTVHADTNPASGKLQIQAEGLWKRFRKAHWPGGLPFDGRLLTDCLADVCAAAGLAPSEYAIEAWDFTFPKAAPGQSPALVYRAGTTCDRILDDFREKFYGLYHSHYFRLADGLFIFDSWNPAAAVSATFYQTSAAASAAGAANQVILDGSYQEVLDESEMANVVAVIGQQADGRPLLARAIDWASINTPAAVNYVGEPWYLVVSDPGFQTQSAVDGVCRRLYDRHRLPRVQAQWKSIRTNVFPGQIVYLSGSNYGAGYVLRGVQLERSADGEASDPVGLASYAAELL